MQTFVRVTFVKLYCICVICAALKRCLLTSCLSSEYDEVDLPMVAKAFFASVPWALERRPINEPREECDTSFKRIRRVG